MKTDQSLKKAFAPSGVLRASLNMANLILAGRDPATQKPIGVSIDLAQELARQLELPLEFVIFDGAGKSVDAVTQEQADVGFFAIDPIRGAGIAFTPPYALIEGCYLVREASPVKTNAEVDQPGMRVVVGKASAYDLHLTRTLKKAEIIRSPTSDGVVDMFVEQGFEVAAGIKQRIEADAKRLGGLRLLPERFMTIRQAMGIPKSRGSAAAARLSRFVEEMKSSGFVAQALARHRIEGVSVAPAE